MEELISAIGDEDFAGAAEIATEMRAAAAEFSPTE